MPITEVPTSPAGAPPEPPRKSKSGRYEHLEHHELLQIMDDLQDERGRARLREFFWISIIIHMIVFWFLLYGPKYVWHRNIRVVDPSEILKQRQKELTYLDLPPDLVKPQKPKQSDVISDKNRTAQSKNPTLDKKTLQQLEAMKKAGPPAPARTPWAAPMPARSPRLRRLPAPWRWPSSRPAGRPAVRLPLAQPRLPRADRRFGAPA